MKNVKTLGLIIAASAVIFCQSAPAADLQVKVVDNRQLPLDFAVVYVSEIAPATAGDTIIVDQVDKEFLPYVTAIRRGDAINFANNDDIRHQIYSFSAPKQFEIPLFRDNPPRPVTFDEAGAVELGCNIHDWMSAYIYVVETDKFVVTDTFGNGLISNLPEGDYEVLVWHPKLDGTAQSTAQRVTIDGSDQSMAFTISQKQLLRAWRAPKSSKRRSY